MRILIAGSGGREHALLDHFSRSPLVSEVLVAPGRNGFSPPARILKETGSDPDRMLDLARKESADLTVIGPEVPLVAGVVDRFERAGLRIFGPRASSARLEGSKVFAKEVLIASGVPTAAYRVVRSMDEVRGALDEVGLPAVIKADGLAAGKGVSVVQTEEEALDRAAKLLVHRDLGESGATLLFEEFLTGEELSILALVRDEDFVLFPPSRDYKRIGDGGTGPNTGGMGAITPVPGVGGDLLDHVRETIFRPVLRTLASGGESYRGILYAGLMLTDDGPMVLEFNCRFGDPETQAVLQIVGEDLFPRFLAVARGEWIDRPLQILPGAAVCLVCASAGYPSRTETGDAIEGLDRRRPEGTIVYHAGTAEKDGEYVTAGGRVLNVVARADTLEAALSRAYEAANNIKFRGKQIRGDIGRPGVQG